MDRDPEGTAFRAAQRQMKLAKRACYYCGATDHVVLRSAEDPSVLVHIRVALLEDHHVFERWVDSLLTAAACHNHHAIATESLRIAGVPLKEVSNPLDRLVARHRNCSALYRDLAEAEDREADDLEELTQFLDAEYPEWRDQWEKRR